MNIYLKLSFCVTVFLSLNHLHGMEEKTKKNIPHKTQLLSTSLPQYNCCEEKEYDTLEEQSAVLKNLSETLQYTSTLIPQSDVTNAKNQLLKQRETLKKINFDTNNENKIKELKKQTELLLKEVDKLNKRAIVCSTWINGQHKECIFTFTQNIPLEKVSIEPFAEQIKNLLEISEDQEVQIIYSGQPVDTKTLQIIYDAVFNRNYSVEKMQCVIKKK